MQFFAKCLKILFEHLQSLCCPISARNSNVLCYIMFQMASRPQNQVVRLTRCLDVPGHTAMLVRVMTEADKVTFAAYHLEGPASL